MSPPVSPLSFLHQSASPILIPCDLERVLLSHNLPYQLAPCASSSDSGFLDLQNATHSEETHTPPPRNLSLENTVLLYVLKSSSELQLSLF